MKRQTRAMPANQFILAMVLACYVGFSRLHHMRFLQREPMLTGILGVLRLPPRCTFWRFLASSAFWKVCTWFGECEYIAVRIRSAREPDVRS